jgi:hypothetical protein
MELLPLAKLLKMSRFPPMSAPTKPTAYSKLCEAVEALIDQFRARFQTAPTHVWLTAGHEKTLLRIEQDAGNLKTRPLREAMDHFMGLKIVWDQEGLAVGTGEESRVVVEKASARPPLRPIRSARLGGKLRLGGPW